MKTDQKPIRTHEGDFELPEWVTPIETEVISRTIVREYEEATFLVTTITPLVNGPCRKTYQLAQAELDEFLEGYNDYAEFIVGVTRCDGTTD